MIQSHLRIVNDSGWECGDPKVMDYYLKVYKLARKDLFCCI